MPRRPKPQTGWRKFLSEVFTIVLGVLLALGAQEFVQSLHWKHEVRETRKALDAELSRDLAAFQYRLSQRRCVAARLAELQRWADSLDGKAPIKLKAPIPNIPGFTIRTAVWELTDGEIASRIPLQARLNYAWLYDALTTFEEIRVDEGEAWEKLGAYEDGRSLSATDLREIGRSLIVAKSINSVLAGFEINVVKFARELDIQPETNIEGRAHRIISEWNRDLCRSLL